MPSVRTIEAVAFEDCTALSDAEFGCNLERIQQYTFYNCPNLRRIAIPLKDDIFPLNPIQHRCTQFEHCPNLTTVILLGESTKLSPPSWRVGELKLLPR
eukprot:scaffold30935_cov73-Skeletonema_marinoi.AAC.1